MAAIKCENTQPELRVRSSLHSMGYRFRLHRKDLPGRPDIVLPKFRIAIFVHGCFWHCHNCRYGRVIPETRADYWAAKRKANVTRDRKNNRKLKKQGWKVVTMWECETRSDDLLRSTLREKMAEFFSALRL